MKNSVNFEVDTPKGKATLVEVYMTELGHLMAKIYYQTEKSWVNYRIGNISELTKTADIELLGPPIIRKAKSKKEVF